MGGRVQRNNMNSVGVHSSVGVHNSVGGAKSTLWVPEICVSVVYCAIAVGIGAMHEIAT